MKNQGYVKQPAESTGSIGRKSLLRAAAVSVLLLSSLIFMGLSWNSGICDRAYQAIQFETIYQEDPNLMEGVEYVSQIGQVGSMIVYLGKNGEVLHRQVAKEPVAEIRIKGSKPRSKAIAEARETFLRFFSSWQDGDHQAMLDMAEPGSLMGRSRDKVAEALAASEESLALFSLEDVEVFSPDEWLSSSSRRSGDWEYYLSEEPSTEGVGMISEASVELAFSSPLYEENSREGKVWAVYRNGSWRVQYVGPLETIPVGVSREFKQSWFFEEETLFQVMVEKVVLHTDHFAIFLSERNLTPLSFEPYATNEDHSLLGRLELETSPEARLERMNAACTDYDYTLKRGGSQRGVFNYTPLPITGSRLTISMDDTELAAVIIP